MKRNFFGNTQIPQISSFLWFPCKAELVRAIRSCCLSSTHQLAELLGPRRGACGSWPEARININNKNGDCHTSRCSLVDRINYSAAASLMGRIKYVVLQESDVYLRTHYFCQEPMTSWCVGLFHKLKLSDPRKVFKNCWHINDYKE